MTRGFYFSSTLSKNPSKDKTQTYAIPYSRYAPCDNDLVNLFRQKNFTTNQMNYDFLLLFLLSSAPKPLSVKECMDGFLSISDLSFQETGDFPTTDGLRDSLQELMSLGFLRETGTKTNWKRNWHFLPILGRKSTMIWTFFAIIVCFPPGGIFVKKPFRKG